MSAPPIPSPTMRAALDALVSLAYRFGLASCSDGGLTAAKRRKWNKALAEARAEVERLASKGAERVEVGVEPDTAPRLHIPRDLLTRPEGVRR